MIRVVPLSAIKNVSLVSKRHVGVVAALLVLSLFGQVGVSAQPFGVGLFGEDVPFGSETSLAIGLSNQVNMTLASNGMEFRGTGSHTVTVTSLDVVGYDLYVHAPNGTAMQKGANSIAASANLTPAALAVNTWGYNTTGSTTQFVGMTGIQALIRSGTGPFTTGDSVTMTYGAYANTTKSSGTYSVDVTYTVVGRT